MTLDPKKEWILTATGIDFPFAEQRSKHFRIVDIAHSLSQQCRWNGHCAPFYSVAEHSIRVCVEVLDRTRGMPDIERVDVALWALLHDAAEAYVGDMVSPLKKYTRAFGDTAYTLTEKAIGKNIALAFGLTETEPDLVRAMDLAVCATEWRDLMPTGERGWPADLPMPLPDPILPRGDMKAVERLFLEAYQDIREFRFQTASLTPQQVQSTEKEKVS